MLETILSIAGKPGLYKLVSHGKMNLIVETLDEKKKRVPTFATDRVTSLSDISMFTENEDVPLYQVLANVRDKEEAKPTSLNWRKASAKQLQDYFAEILPDCTRRSAPARCPAPSGAAFPAALSSRGGADSGLCCARNTPKGRRRCTCRPDRSGWRPHGRRPSRRRTAGGSSCR